MQSGQYEKYQALEARYGKGHERRCIDGKITGSGKCVGFCLYDQHRGFLTEGHRERHSCLSNQCMYYLPKPGKIRGFRGEKR